VLDVLTFYSERIADEGYLGTATEARSLVELARTVGYERGPGRSAEALLAFTLDGSPGSPPVVQIPAGTQVASLPGPGELPQTFETSAPLTARPAWNMLTARTQGSTPPAPDARGMYLRGQVTALDVGDAVLLAGEPGSPVSGPWALRTVSRVTPMPAQTLTRVEWAEALPASLPLSSLRAYALRLSTGLFGATAPDWRVIPADTKKQFLQAAPANAPVAVLRTHTRAAVGPDDWPDFDVVPKGLTNTVDLEGAHPDLVAGSWLVLQAPAKPTEPTKGAGPAGSGPVSALYRVRSSVVGSRSDFAVSGRTTRVWLDGPLDVGSTFPGVLRTTVAFAASELLDLAPAPVVSPVTGTTVELDAAVDMLPAGRPVVVSGPAPWLRVADDTSTLTLTRPDGSVVPVRAGEVLQVRGSGEVVGGVTVWPVQLDGVTGTLAAAEHQAAIVPPPDGAARRVEAAVVAVSPADVTGQPTTPTLRLTAPLVGCYDRGQLRIAANVAAASHGESRTEVLGSGDAGTVFQRFRLAQAPLTHVDGVSSLVVRVDGVAWSEVRSLHGHGGTDRVYVVRLADDDTVTVHFGDGVTGARLPTGEENVVVDYRAGTGLAGHLPADRLTLLMTRPLGVRSVTNPLPTGLAADPDSPGDLRRLAPRTALTLDRVVSVTDVADAARQTPGIAKAASSIAWTNERPVIHLTVAGEAGQPVDDIALASLRAELRAAGDPHVGLVAEEAQTVRFLATVAVFVEAGHQPSVVRGAVRSRLLEVFGFTGRDLGQPVAASEVTAVAQRVSGVSAVTLTRFQASEATTTRPMLPARAAGPAGPAQLRLLDPGELTVDVAT
jgi:predicted phage baseplate assembly protein